MGRIIVTEHVTLDGVVEDNGGVEGFERGGWQFQFDSGEDGEAFKLQEMRNSTALLLGRVTYDVFAQHWPSAQGELFGLTRVMKPVAALLARSEGDRTFESFEAFAGVGLGPRPP